MKSDEIRDLFLRFFGEKGHTVIPSSSLIPKGDPTLLLTNAGMVQIKPYFLGEAVPPCPRLASCQKCFRTSDIESVGDATHLTFFEMLGNFSVGGYFKKEAIAWGWEFVTEWLKLDPERLWVTIYLDDDESFELWKDIGVLEKKILRFGEEDNFWGPAGSSGPCGPCSEIHYDFGADMGCGKSDCRPNCECGRFTELWNLVFTQYNQDEAGNRTPLSKPNIDTGMGLERLVAIMSDHVSVYETDLFDSLLDCIAGLTGNTYGTSVENDTAMRVVADHGRALAFLIADGVIPGNEGRGYVLRRLLRRATLYGMKLGLDKPFLAEIAQTAINKMKLIYPELAQRQEFINKVIRLEEARFDETLKTGLEIIDGVLEYRKINKDIIPELVNFINIDRPSSENAAKVLEQHGFTGSRGETSKQIGVSIASESVAQLTFDYLTEIENVVDRNRINEQELIKKITDLPTTVSGYEAFRLYDTYGFPVELTKEIVAESGFTVDMAGYEHEMEKQRERARSSHKFDIATGKAAGQIVDVVATEFVGYHHLEQPATVIKLVVDGNEVDTVEAGQVASLVLDTSPFYGEMGGQVGDTGEIVGLTGHFTVTDTVRIQSDVNLHQGKITEGHISIGDVVTAIVDMERRLDIARNHTATHLLQSALRQVLGEHIQQRGSLVAPDRLRFDFSHLAAMTPEEIKEVQHIVNDKIRRNLRVYDEETSYQEAVSDGAIALFDEKYGDVVRVMRIGEPVVSAELCGGTHVDYTGEIGYFHIINEGSIGAGLRRIEAVTGRGAETIIERGFNALEGVARSLETTQEGIRNKVAGLVDELDKEHRLNKSLLKEMAIEEAKSLLSQVEVINGINLLVAKVNLANIERMREMGDYIRDKLKSVIIILGGIFGSKPFFIAAVTQDLVDKGYNAGDIIKKVAGVAGGGGGGKANFAQAGGRDKSKLDEALSLVKSLI